MPPHTEALVSAKDVADYAFCPESLRLRLAGAKPSAAARVRMAAGTRAHAVWTRAGRREEAGLRPALLAAFAVLLVGAILLLLQAL